MGYIDGSNNSSNVGFIIDCDVPIRFGGAILGACDERYVETTCGINIDEVTLGVFVDDEVDVFVSGFAGDDLGLNVKINIGDIVCAG